MECEGLWGLDYWKSKDWEIIKGRLNELDTQRSGLDGNSLYNPNRDCLFDNLRMVRPSDVKVVICGQDPYPDGRYATGLAFSIPRKFDRTEFPSSLKIIFNELSTDLAVGLPTHGDLSRWAQQGVLLWNAIPTCLRGVSLSHNWREYIPLTTEVLRKVAEHGAVFCFLGAISRGYSETIGTDNPNCPVISTGHPSPRGNMNSSYPFTGSRFFSSVNDKLGSIGLEPIDWRIDATEGNTSSKGMAGDASSRKSGRVLQNTTGTSCGPLYDKRGICIRE